MGYTINAWAADGSNSESELIQIRIKRIAEIPAIIEQLIIDYPECVRITKERYGKYAKFYTLWLAPNYIDPFGDDVKLCKIRYIERPA